MSLSSGQIFGNYEIIEMIGKGGMGEVYRAKDLRLNREVAIKILDPRLIENPQFLVRFRKEAGLAAKLNHPNICTIYEAGEAEGQAYISMEYVRGETLRARIKKGPIPLAEALDIAVQIADGLDEARRENVLHRDIKSLNILLTERGRAKILDFGLAKQLGPDGSTDSSGASTKSELTQEGGVCGTPSYMSPEQALGRSIDHRSDIFSFGIVLYEMLTERVPFPGNSPTEIIDKILHSPPVPVARYNDEIPSELARVITKMLEKDPDLRYQSVHEVWTDLRHIQGQSTAGKTSPMIAPPRTKWKLTNIFVVLTLVALVVVAYRWRGKVVRDAGVTATPGKAVSIAVLPFRYIGEDPERQYLGALVTDGLIAGLRAVPGLELAPYANVREMKPADSIQAVSRELGVQWVIRGAVATKNDDVEITPELVSQDGKIVWKQRITDRPLSALGSVTKNILDEFHLADSAKKTVAARTPKEEAYKDYIDARNRQEGWDVQDNLEESEKLYRAAIEKDPDFAAPRAGLAMVLLKRFQETQQAALLSSANQEAQRALGLDPNIPETLLAYGMVRAESGNSIEAQDAFRKALLVAPGDDFTCRSIAELYAGLGRNEEAEEMYKRAVDLRSSYWRNHYALGMFLWQNAGKLDLAKQELKLAANQHSEGYAPFVMLGVIFLTEGNLQESETYFKDALERAPNTYSYNNLGLVYYYRGQFDLALHNWQALLKDAPDRPMYQANVADALRQLGRNDEASLRYKQAIDGFRTVLKTNPTDDKTRAGMAMALAATAQCNEALAETRAALERQPDSSELNAYGAITASRCGNVDWAKQIALKSIAAGNLLVVRFDPDLASLRKVSEVQDALQQALTASANLTNAGSKK